MNNVSEKVSLSVGELAFALGVQYSGEAALNIVQRQFELPDDESTDLFLSASGQSLLARDLLQEEAEDEYKLAAPLEDAVRRLYEASRTIICNRSSAQNEDVYLALHFSPAGIVRHSVRNETVHELEVLPDVSAATRAVNEFFSVPDELLEDVPMVRMRQRHADKILQSEERAFIEAQLPAPYVSEKTRDALASDLLDSSFRGAVVRVDHQEDGASMMTPRFFVLKGSARIWLLQPYLLESETFVEFSLGSKQTLADALLHVIQEATSS